MIGSTIGTLFRVTTFGESHGVALGAVVEGCPSDLPIDLEQVRKELGRRKPGQSSLVTQRREEDEFEIVSGLFEGKTIGSPIAALFRNQDTRSKDYDAIKDVFRPGHADFTYFAKYHHRDHRGGGRASARETVARVFAGAIAKQLLATGGISIAGGVIQIGKVQAKRYVWEQVETNEIRSVDPDTVEPMMMEIESARKERDSVGGIVEVQALGVPAGLGEPVFAKLDAAIGASLMSIPAVKGVEIGAGFSSASARGSKFQDQMFEDGFHTNNHGGILGGISSGAPIVARIVLKPTSSLPQELQTVNKELNAATVTTLGRHDPCVAIRAVPVAEAMLAITLADFWLQELALRSARSLFSDVSPVRYPNTSDKK